MLQKAFTLTELVVVIAIIALIAAVAIPNVQKFLERGRDAKRITDMRVIEAALEAFFEDSGRYPNFADDGVLDIGECIGDAGNAEGECLGESDIEVALSPYIRGGSPRDPLHPGKDRNNNGVLDNDEKFFYAYDPVHYVNWVTGSCNCAAGVNECPALPVLGFRNAETEAIIHLEHKDTDCGTNMELDAADYNLAFR